MEGRGRISVGLKKGGSGFGGRDQKGFEGEGE